MPAVADARSRAAPDGDACDRRALQMFSREFAAPGTSWSPGTTGAGGRPSVSPVLRQFAWLIAKEQVTPTVTLGETTVPVTLPPPQPQLTPEPLAASPGTWLAGPWKTVPLVQIAFGRSGDKGDTSNIGLIARHQALLPVLKHQVMPERVQEYFGHLVQGRVHRYELPGIDAINLVCERALGGGGMASLRNDALGKGMAQMLLDMPVEVPLLLQEVQAQPQHLHDASFASRRWPSRRRDTMVDGRLGWRVD
jgi:hypothetical protein